MHVGSGREEKWGILKRRGELKSGLENRWCSWRWNSGFCFGAMFPMWVNIWPPTIGNVSPELAEKSEIGSESFPHSAESPGMLFPSDKEQSTIQRDGTPANLRGLRRGENTWGRNLLACSPWLTHRFQGTTHVNKTISCLGNNYLRGTDPLSSSSFAPHAHLPTAWSSWENQLQLRDWRKSALPLQQRDRETPVNAASSSPTAKRYLQPRRPFPLQKCLESVQPLPSPQICFMRAKPARRSSLFPVPGRTWKGPTSDQCALFLRERWGKNRTGLSLWYLRPGREHFKTPS